ncbi:hypothetical protein HK101_004491 [Irineochytrium annulatum]|nr:hypothetical protein HK101_004491 [Irineochytrium annulatum]
MSTTTLTARAMSNAVSHRSADASRVNSAGATTTEDETDWSERSERGLMGQVAERSDYNKAAERARRRREERMRREREGAIAQKDVDRCGEESEIAMDRQKRRGEERERADAGIRPEDGPAVMDGPSTVDAISSASSDTCCSESVVHVASARKSIESAERYNVRGSLVVLDEVFDDYNYVSLERGRRESTVVGDLGDSEEEGKVGGESGNGEELTETEGEEGPRVTKPMNSSFPTIDGGKERRVTKTINTNVLTTSTINANTPSHPRAPENDEDDDDKSFTDLLDLYGTADDVIRRSIGLEPEDRIPFVFRYV